VKIEIVNPGNANEGFGPILLERTNVTGLAHKNGVIANGKRTAGQRDVRLVSSTSTISRRSILAAPGTLMVRASLRSAGLCRHGRGQGDSDGAEHGGAAADAVDQDPEGFPSIQTDTLSVRRRLEFPARFGSSPVLVENRPENLIETVAAEGE
jgi:hypothetical protein